MIRLYIIAIALLFSFGAFSEMRSQCAQVLDGSGLATSNPNWYSCSGENPSLSINTSTDWTDLVIDWGDGSPEETFGAYSSADEAAQHAYDGSQSVYTVTLSEADGSCSVEGHFFVGAPQSDFWSSQTQTCAGTAIQFHQETTGVNYLWNFGVNPTFLPTSTGHVSYTFQNAGQYNVQSVIYYPGQPTCADTTTITVNILPNPVVTMTLSTTEGCGSATVSGTVSAANSYIYSWAFAAPPYIQSGMNLNPVTFGSVGNHAMSATVTGWNGCQTTKTQMITVHPEPVADFNVDPICIGTSAQFYDNSSAHWSTDITGWFWQFGDGGISYQSTPEHDYAFTGDYEVALTVTTPDCASTTSQFVSVNPLPTVDILADVEEGCAPLTVALEADATLANEFFWTIGETALTGESIDFTFADNAGANSPQTIELIAQSSAGCTAIDSLMVDVFPTPVAAFSLNSDAGCAPFNINASNESTDGTTYQWLLDGSLVSSNEDWTGVVQNESGIIQSHSLTLIAASVQGCLDTTSVEFDVYPRADFSYAMPIDSACSPVEITMPEIEGTNNFTWSYGTGITTTEATPTFNFENTTNGLMGVSITFAGISPFGCTDLHTETVYILPQPEAAFSYDVDTGCEPLAVNLDNLSTQADSYMWDFGDGISDDGIMASHAFGTDGSIATYEITLTAMDDLGCTDQATHTVTVYPSADFNLDLTVENACSPVELTMPLIPGAQNIQWNFGDGITSNEATPTHSWTNDTDGLVSVIVMVEAETVHGCGGSAIDLLQIKPQPTASFTSDAVNGCEPLVAEFQSTSSANDTHAWTFGDGNSDNAFNVAHTFETAGEDATYEIALTVTHALGCSDTATQSIDVYAAPVYALNLASDSACSPLELTMPTLVDAQNIAWDFGDGSTSTEASPTHVWYNNSGELDTYTITVNGTSSNGCAGTATATAHVKPQPIANFTTNTTSGCDPLVTEFSNYSSLADSFEWNFGDGETSHELNPTHAFMAEGTEQSFEVVLTAMDDLGCSDVATETVTVFPAAAFSLSIPSDSVCSPMTLTLPAIPGAQNITWDFGDGTTSSEVAPTHTWVNDSSELMEFTISFEAETQDGCIGSQTASVFVKPQPQANFSIPIASGCEPFEAVFTNNSSNGDTYIWNFGDQLTPAVFNMDETVTHTYFAAEESLTSFEVTLIAIDALGCADERSMSIEVFPTPIYELALEESEACSPLTIAMPALDNVSTALWVFGDGTMSNEITPTHSWVNDGNELLTQTIEFFGNNEFGCAGVATAEVSINPQPIANFSMAEAAGCAPFDLILNNSSELASQFDWNYGDGSVADLTSSGTHAHLYVGEEDVANYTVTLTAIHELGCSDSHQEIVTVYPSVTAEGVGELEGCEPFELNLDFTGTPNSELMWAWDGNQSEDEMLNVSLAAMNEIETSYSIQLVATSAFGCTDSAEFIAIVHPTPVINLTSSVESSCTNDEWMVFPSASVADSTSLTIGEDMTWSNPEEEVTLVSFNESEEDQTLVVTYVAVTNQGCTAQESIEHIVHPIVTAAFATPESQCTPFDVVFENQSFQATGGLTWDFGDGTSSSEEQPAHVFETNSTLDTTFIVTLTAVNSAGCTDITSQTVEVYGRPVATLILDSLTGCYPVDATFVNASVGHSLTSWNYGNGEFALTADSVHTKTFFNPSDELVTYTTSMTVSNDHGCESMASVSLDVAPYLNAQFDFVGEGCSPVDAQLINQSEGAASFIWNFNDGSALSNESNPDHVFTNNSNEDITFHVELIALSAYGCVDTMTVGIDVYPMPVAEFSVTPIIQTYPNTTVGINNLSTASESAVQYWSFGDGDEVAADQPIFHTYDSWGSYNITLLVDNGVCADAHTEQINILSPHPVASFTGEGSGCAPLMVEFENHSNHGAGYIWDFGDDHMTSEESPVHVFSRPGIYNISLTVIGFEGQEEQVIHYEAVEVFPSATAAFVNTPSEVIVPDQPVEFVNLSGEDAIEFLWTFGDGQVSTERDPIHFYTEAGIYDVTLTANNEFNCPATFTLEHAVEATVGGFMEFPTAFTPNSGGGSGGSYDPAALDNDIFHPHHTGIVEYELVIFNKWGELIFRTTDPYIGWDGFYQGRLARQDVYAWKAIAKFSNGHRITKSGDVTLIIQ